MQINMERFCQAMQRHLITPKTILEIGSRDGNDANEIANYFNITHNNVWVCEPNPKQIVSIEHQYPNFNIVKKAIFNQKGMLPFIQMNGTIDEIGTSSLIQRTFDNLYANANIIEVEAITGEELLTMINKPIDACKIDVEGATLQVLESMGKLIHNITAFHLECEHTEVWKNQHQYNEIANYMLKHNFIQIDFSFTMYNIQSDSIWIKE
jgi:FkbM family methyltransferase